MAEDTHQFFSQMDKKKKILEKIRKAIYDDMLWEDKDARYVSWLEPESLDDVDFIGHCQDKSMEKMESTMLSLSRRTLPGCRRQ